MTRKNVSTCELVILSNSAQHHFLFAPQLIVAGRRRPEEVCAWLQYSIAVDFKVRNAPSITPSWYLQW